jgi:hypothetical protein
MKVKLFNGTLISLSLQVVAGGYDPEVGRVTLMVKGENDQAGTLLFDVSEARRIRALLTEGVPEVERVNQKENTP